MKQKFHNYLDWEEYKNGMWRKVSKSEELKFLKLAIKFTSDAKKYGDAMLRVVDEWPISCEQNLTNNDINKKAWIGHAACCIAFNCPEYIVRDAWSYLNVSQQNKANERAEEAIKYFYMKQYDLKQIRLFEDEN